MGLVMSALVGMLVWATIEVAHAQCRTDGLPMAYAVRGVTFRVGTPPIMVAESGMASGMAGGVACRLAELDAQRDAPALAVDIQRFHATPRECRRIGNERLCYSW